jgi:hypothetical protein
MCYLPEGKFKSFSDYQQRLIEKNVFIIRIRSYEHLYKTVMKESELSTRENTLMSIDQEDLSNSVLKTNEDEESELNMYESIIKEKIRLELRKSASKIQSIYRMNKILIKTKRQFLLINFKKILSSRVTKIQSYMRKYFIRRNYANIIRNLPKNFYLLKGDYFNSEIKEASSLKLIIYETLNDREIMTYHDFFFSKSHNKFFLFIKRQFFERNDFILVNFVADGHIFNNYNYRTLYKIKDSFYNVLSISDMEIHLPRGRYYSGMSLPNRILRTNYYSPKIKNARLFLKKKKVEKRVAYCPVTNSNENLKLTKYTSILKPTSKKVSISTKNSKKIVTFSEVVYESS